MKSTPEYPQNPKSLSALNSLNSQHPSDSEKSGPNAPSSSGNAWKAWPSTIYPWLVQRSNVSNVSVASSRCRSKKCRSFCQLLPAIIQLCPSLQRHELRVLAHHTRATVLDGLVGDGELTQVVANHLLKRETKHWSSRFHVFGWHIWDGHRLDLHGDVLLAIVHTHHASLVASAASHRVFHPCRHLKLPSGQSSLASGWLAQISLPQLVDLGGSWWVSQMNFTIHPMWDAIIWCRSSVAPRQGTRWPCCAGESSQLPASRRRQYLAWPGRGLEKHGKTLEKYTWNGLKWKHMAQVVDLSRNCLLSLYVLMVADVPKKCSPIGLSDEDHVQAVGGNEENP